MPAFPHSTVCVAFEGLPLVHVNADDGAAQVCRARLNPQFRRHPSAITHVLALSTENNFKSRAQP